MGLLSSSNNIRQHRIDVNSGDANKWMESAVVWLEEHFPEAIKNA